MKLQFPIKHIEENLVFGHNGTVWAYFKVDGFSYDFLDDDGKIGPFNNQMSFLVENNLDFNFFVVPNPTNIDEIMRNTIEEMKLKDYALKEKGIFYMEQVKESLERDKELNETSEYSHYLGIQLNEKKNKYKTTNIGLSLVSSVKSFLQGFNSPIYNAVGLEKNDILESEIEAYKNQARVIQSNLSSSFSSLVKRIKAIELVYIIEKLYSTRANNSDVKLRNSFVSGELVTGYDENGAEHKAVRYRENDFLDLQDTNVRELNANTLLLSRINEAFEEEELYVRYLTVSQMDDVMFHPGNEWLYHLQSHLPFPIAIMIRAEHQPNDMIRKKLDNALLEYEDQRREAEKAMGRLDSSVQESEQGAIRMENYFKRTGFPAYSTKFIFRIIANDYDSLQSRTDRLVRELSRYNVKVVSPYGEQLQLMLDMIPSSDRSNDDYTMELAPTVLASLMFGATNNIGDNRGFYIGHTRMFSKPVFIQPDLAAKAYEGLGNVVDSLSVLVAGMTGKGKSFFMNLFTYLSVLNGSSALIIDPKGDRGGWVNGLPYIDKENIEVWTLGSDANDAGSLDPFRTSASMQDAKDITMDILSYLADININDDRHSLLSDAIEKASNAKDPCIGEVINYLKDLFDNRPESMSDSRYETLESLIGTLNSLRRNQLSMLLFGEPGQKFKVLEHSKAIQVLMVQNLNLPGPETQTLRISHKISEAIMISITSWTKQYMFKGDRSVHKIILQDEASAIESNAMGAELMDFIVRQGRYYNTTLLKGSQNATDHGSNIANIGMKFSFGLSSADEAKKMLHYLNLPQTESNIYSLQNLDRGEALFQDIYGRSAIIKVNPIFQDLFDAFDSSTATEEEKERERKRGESVYDRKTS